MGRSSSPIQKKPLIWTNLDELGCARFPEFVQNLSERQISWSLCSVVFHAFALKLPIQTSISVVSELPVSLSSHAKCPNFRKTSTPLERACFPEFLENFGERQILWSLCSVVFKCARWHLNSQFLCVQVKNVKKVRKTSTPLEQAEPMKENESENRL